MHCVPEHICEKMGYCQGLEGDTYNKQQGSNRQEDSKIWQDRPKMLTSWQELLILAFMAHSTTTNTTPHHHYSLPMP
jgi:hypothetical protein